MRFPGASLLALLCVLVSACAKPEGTAWLPARLSVEVLRGFEPEQVAVRDREGPIVVLVDSTLSMAAPTEFGADYGFAARGASKRFIDALPSRNPVWLYAMGGEPGQSCRPLRNLARVSRRRDRQPLLGQLDQLRPGSEGSLAAALDRARGDLVEAGGLVGSRVVLFSDLASECGGDLCAAAEKLAEGGARLDVVLLGKSRAPACLREPSGLSDIAPPSMSAPGADSRIHYRLELLEPDPLVVGCSVVGGPPVAAPAGRATVVVDLDPPLRVDAYFAPGRDHVLQVLDFPAFDPPVLRWRWKEAAVEFSGQ